MAALNLRLAFSEEDRAQFSKSLLENLPTVGGTDLDLPGQDAACR
jgi:hypothetical protein